MVQVHLGPPYFINITKDARLTSGVKWEISSVGRASALQAGGQRFEPVISHHFAEIAQLVEQLICNQ